MLAAEAHFFHSLVAQKLGWIPLVHLTSSFDSFIRPSSNVDQAAFTQVKEGYLHSILTTMRQHLRYNRSKLGWNQV
jgi:hypothetical protein